MDGDLEKDAKALAGKDGWILKQNFTKYALNTDLCKEQEYERSKNTFGISTKGNILQQGVNIFILVLRKEFLSEISLQSALILVVNTAYITPF